MDNKHELDARKYIEDPDALVALCESVLNDLLASINDTELREKQAQLIEVSRSIDQLTKLSIGIPGELRNLKIDLVTEIETQKKSREKLEKIIMGLKEIVNPIDVAYFTPPKKKRTRKRRSISELTRREVFRIEIIDALKILGGAGKVSEIQEIIEKRMKDKFLPGDLDKTASGELVWKNDVRWARIDMKNDGVLRNDSPKGTWELSEDYK